MKKLIITADDYGMSPAVNSAIEECIQAGTVTSTNIMMNMEYIPAKKLKEKYPHISVGIHFVLTDGPSVLGRDKVKSLTDQNGLFYPRKIFKERYLKGQIKKSEIIAELYAQYNRFKQMYGQPDYWNTHEHIHLGFGIFKQICSLTDALKIKKFRCNKKIYAGKLSRRTRSVAWIAKSKLKNKAIAFLYRDKKNIPDGIITYYSDIDYLDINRVFSDINWGKNSLAELIIHPAAEADSKYLKDFAAQRVEEYRFYKNAELTKAAKKFGIELVNFSGEVLKDGGLV